MTNAQKIQIRQSQIRERLNEISNPETELTDENKAEMNSLMVEMSELEPRLRAAITAEQETIESRNDGTSENSPLDDLRQRASVSEYLRQAVHGQPIEGACKELNQELGITAVRGQGGGVLMPVEQLALRADVPNTTLTGADADSTNRRPIFSRLFARGVLEAMGIRIDSVPVGLIEYPILTDATDPEMTAENTDGPDTVAAQWNSEVLKPKRMISRYEFTAESIATIPNLESALSSDLQMSITSQMSKEALTGDGTGANVRGLDTAITFPNDPSGVVNFTDAIQFGLSAIDGLHAESEADISVVLGPATYRKVAGILQTSTTENAFDVLRRRGTTVVTSAHVAAPALNIQKGYIHAGRDMARGDSIAAVWPAIELIRDPYTKAASSKTIITAVMLWDLYAGFRAAAYKGLKAKLA